MKQQRKVSRDDDRRDILDFYTQPAAMTSVGRHARPIAELPGEVEALAHIVQGLVVHQYMADAYGFKVPEARKAESHIRPVEEMLDRLLAIDGRPLSAARPVEKRLVGICHHFALIFVAMLRAKGVPARYRCGFGAFFNAPFFEDHLVCEYWNAAQARWILADAQLDDVWQRGLKYAFDPLDVPRDQFLTASDAWTRCRSGQADPSKFGIFVGNLRGLWFIAAELVRDVAALNNMEMLPWDIWGAMPRPDQRLDAEQLALFDRLALLTSAPDASFAELRQLYKGDERLRVPPTVFNALLNQQETV